MGKGNSKMGARKRNNTSQGKRDRVMSKKYRTRMSEDFTGKKTKERAREREQEEKRKRYGKGEPVDDYNSHPEINHNQAPPMEDKAENSMNIGKELERRTDTGDKLGVYYDMEIWENKYYPIKPNPFTKINGKIIFIVGFEYDGKRPLSPENIYTTDINVYRILEKYGFATQYPLEKKIVKVKSREEKILNTES